MLLCYFTYSISLYARTAYEFSLNSLCFKMNVDFLLRNNVNTCLYVCYK